MSNFRLRFFQVTEQVKICLGRFAYRVLQRCFHAAEKAETIGFNFRHRFFQVAEQVEICFGRFGHPVLLGFFQVMKQVECFGFVFHLGISISAIVLYAILFLFPGS